MSRPLRRRWVLPVLGLLLAGCLAAQPTTTPPTQTPNPAPTPPPAATPAAPGPPGSPSPTVAPPAAAPFLGLPLPGAATAPLPEQARAPQQLFEELPRFGASLFASLSAVPPSVEDAARAATQPVSNQPVSPEYTLGPGDRLALRVWAKNLEQVNEEVALSPEGAVILPEVGRVPASGQTLEELRETLRQAYSRFFTNPIIVLAVAEQRTVEVFVTGDATRPGKYTLSGMATALTALYAAGGPSAIGSFRRLGLQRVGQPTVTLDLYDYLLTGRRDQDMVLRPGDSIFVPTVAAEVGLCGEVRRPARYELQGEVTLGEALQLAGGLKPSAYAPMLHLWRQDAGAKWRLSAADVSKPDSPDLKLPLRDGDLVIVKGILNTGANTMQLIGAVKRPGYYPVTPEATVSSLLRAAEGLVWNAHMGLGVVRRMDEQRHYYVIPFDVREQMYAPSPKPIPLESKDEVEVYFQDQVEPAKQVVVQGAVVRPGTYEWTGDLKVSQLIALAGGLAPEAYLKRADLLRLNAEQKYEVVRVELGAALKGEAPADIPVARGDILKVSRLVEAEPPAEVQAAGYVRLPGKYPRREGMKVSDLLFAAGGLRPGAGPEVLLIRGRFEGAPQTEKLALAGDPAAYRVEPDPALQDDDSIAVLGRGRFKDLADLVSIQGRVKTPGSYALNRLGAQAYTVHDLLQEAGGLLEEANPGGIVVYRKRDFYIGQAQSEDLSRVLASVNREANQPPLQLSAQDQATAFATTVNQGMREVMSGPGAAAIVLPPRPVRPEDWVAAIPVFGKRLLQTHGKEGNLDLEPGDMVVVPRRINTVMILGAVPRSGAVPFLEGKNTMYYVNESGGFREDAASDRMVVIHPNGAATPVRGGSLVEPGDVIVVPTKHIVRVVRTESAWTQWAKGILSVIVAALAF